MGFRAILVIISALGLAATMDGVSAMAAEGEQAVSRNTFLILYRPGAKWDGSKRVWEQELGGHKDYLIDQYAGGILKFAGPFIDDWGGGVVVQTIDAQAAAEIARNDPAVLNGVFVFEIHPWFLVDWDEAMTQRNTMAETSAGQ